MRRWDGLTVILAGTAAFISPHVLLALGCTFAAGGIRLVARDASRVERAALAVALAGLGVATWLLATIIGPLPATYAALRDGPVGDPAARLVMLLLAVPATVFLFDWRLIPAGAAILGRIGPELLPAGMILWQGIAMPLALVLAAFALRKKRSDLLALAIGAFGLWSAGLPGWGAGLPGRVGGGAVLGARMLGREPGDLARLLAAGGTAVVLYGAIRVQFVYTVLLGGLLVWALIRRWLR